MPLELFSSKKNIIGFIIALILIIGIIVTAIVLGLKYKNNERPNTDPNNKIA